MQPSEYWETEEAEVRSFSLENIETLLHHSLSPPPSVCVCVCVCERERERERDTKQKILTTYKTQNIYLVNVYLILYRKFANPNVKEEK